MRFNFRQISALATSALMIGMTAGVAAAANYPAPFVAGGAANVAVVYGTGAGVSVLDTVQAGSIQTNLQSFMTGTTGGGSTSTSGETISLDTSATRIWLNTSINTAKSQLTKTDLPTVLADYSFSGDVTSKITSTLKFFAGATSGDSGDNTGKIIFSKQPTSSDDPVIGLSLGTSATSNPLYNATVTMSAINFTDPDSEGEEIVLFGQTFTVASETDDTYIVLLKDADRLDLTNTESTGTVTVGGESYTIELTAASDTSATIKVTNSAGASQTKKIDVSSSKRVNGIDIAVTQADENNFALSASVIAGSQKITIASGSTVTVGEDDDPIDGTYAYIVGGTAAATELTIAVFRADSSTDAILPGESFVDPVFGSFKIDFAGLSSPLDDSNRATISVKNSGDKDMEVSLVDDSGNAKTFNFAHNESGLNKLGSNDNYSIATIEMANLSMSSGFAKYVVVGNEDYGHLLELYDVYNQSGGASLITNDRVKFKDVITADTYETTFTSTEGVGTMDVDGKRYTVYFNGTGEDAYVRIKYPTADSGAENEYVIFPTIETANGALISLYQPTILNISDMNLSAGQNDAIAGGSTTGSGSIILNLPDGDGYTAVTLTANATAAYESVWKVGTNTTQFITNTTANTYNAIGMNTNMSITVGTLTYMLTSIGSANRTQIALVDPEGAAIIDNPALVVIEGKDDKTQYHAIVVDLNTNPAGDSTTPIEVNDILFSSDYYHASATLASDSDLTQDIDWWGTLTTKDANDAATKATISYPKSQVYASLFVGASDSSVSGGTTTGGTTQLGEILVKDSEVSSVSSKNLIVVGGSCINSVAASLIGGAKCGSGWTTATGIGSGQFLIQSFAYGDKTALLVAGYDAADTVNAATYLRTKTVDTAIGKKYVGTSATTATLQVA